MGPPVKSSPVQDVQVTELRPIRRRGRGLAPWLFAAGGLIAVLWILGWLR
jgi:hypothetical protein